MKFVTIADGTATSAGLLLDGDRVLRLTDAHPALADLVSALDIVCAGERAVAAAREVAANTRTDKTVALEAVKLLAPIPRPRKNIFCVGRNYKEHILESARARGTEPSFPKIPEFFSKPPTAVVGPDAGIERHRSSTAKLDYEVELAVVIGKPTRDASIDKAIGHVFGYTIVNDVSARDAQVAHGQWFKGKSFDTFCPMGPCIVTRDEFGEAGGHRIALRVNGEIRQDSNTRDLLFDVSQIVASLSAAMTLEPGDVIATGTPSGVALGMTPQRWLEVGDLVEAEIEGIGCLRNRVIE